MLCLVLFFLSLNRFLDIDSAAWSGLEETSGSSFATRHVGPVCHTTISLCHIHAHIVIMYSHFTYIAQSH